MARARVPGSGKSTRLWLLLSLLQLLLLACTPAPPDEDLAQVPPAPQAGQAASQASFTDFKLQVLERFWRLHPEYALRNGRYEFAGSLVIPDAGQHNAEREFWQGLLDALGSYPLQELSAVDASDWYILQQEAESALWYLDTYQATSWDASGYNVGPLIGFILNTEYAPQTARLEAVQQVLEQVPAYYRQARGNLQQLTVPHTELAIVQNQGTLALLTQTVPDVVRQSGLPAVGQSQLMDLAAQGATAVADYIQWLEQSLPGLEDPLARNFRLGEKLYSEKFRHDLKSGLDAEQAYSRAMAEKQRLHEQMLTLATDLWPAYFPEQAMPQDPLALIAQVIGVLAAEHATPTDFVDEVRQQIPDLEAFVVAQDLLSIDPEKPLVVRETPQYQRGFSVASIEAPGPYDSFANTYYNVEPVDTLAAGEAESFLREYNRRMMQILNIHEAIPGHYTQLVHANKSPSLIKAVFGNTTMVEGWAVYAERMMLEAGYGNFEPELWLMWYKWNLRTVVNTILDYRIQVENLQEDAALDLLMREAFQERTEAVGKWRRAMLSQVQLASYFTGYADIYALQQEQRVRLGDAFNLKQFHDTFLGFGSAPVPVIRTLMQQE